MNKPYLKAALTLGLCPLLLGTAIFILWCLTRQPGLEAAGIAVIAGGIACFVVGLFCVGRHNRWIGQQPTDQRRRLRRQSRIAWAALLANFPAAVAIVAAVIFIHQSYRVRAVNHTSQPLAATLTGGGVNKDLGAIPAGGARASWFFVQHDGELVLTTTRAGQKTNVTVESYVTNGMGGSARVDFNADGSVSVSDLTFDPPRTWSAVSSP